MEWQTEIELKLLLCSSPPEQISANYLHVKGIFDLWAILVLGEDLGRSV